MKELCEIYNKLMTVLREVPRYSEPENFGYILAHGAKTDRQLKILELLKEFSETSDAMLRNMPKLIYGKTIKLDSFKNLPTVSDINFATRISLKNFSELADITLAVNAHLKEYTASGENAIDELVKPCIGYTVAKVKLQGNMHPLPDLHRASCVNLIVRLQAISDQNVDTDIIMLLDDSADYPNMFNIKNMICDRFGCTIVTPKAAIKFLKLRLLIHAVPSDTTYALSTSYSLDIKSMNRMLTNELVIVNKVIAYADTLAQIAYVVSRKSNFAKIDGILQKDKLKIFSDIVTDFLKPKCCNCLAICENEKRLISGNNAPTTMHYPCKMHTYCDNCKFIDDAGCPLCKYTIDTINRLQKVMDSNYKNKVLSTISDPNIAKDAGDELDRLRKNGNI